jgi:transposase
MEYGFISILILECFIVTYLTENRCMLECAAAAGEIDLFYADESGFSLWMPVTYSYYFQGRQKRQEQTPSKGRRVSILGLFHPLLGFIYGLVLGSFNSKRYIKMMDEQAQQAHQVLTHTGRIRVIVQDNGPIYTSKAVQQKWPEWQEKGLYMFFLAKYCSEMNPIEGEWHQIKTHELRGRMFENELDLAYAVMDGIDARAKAAGYQAERFKFPSRTPDS